MKISVINPVTDTINIYNNIQEYVIKVHKPISKNHESRAINSVLSVIDTDNLMFQRLFKSIQNSVKTNDDDSEQG